MKRLEFRSLLVVWLVLTHSVVVAASEMNPGDILACHSVEDGAVNIVDPETGDQQVLSDLGDPGQGPTFLSPRDLALDSGGTIALLETNIPAIFWVDPQTGQRSLLSNLSDPSQGPTATTVWAITTSADQSFLVTLRDPTALLVRVDRGTGQRTVVSDFSDAGMGLVGIPTSAVELPSGEVLVNTFLIDTSTSAILRVDAESGQRSLVSDFGEGGPNAFGLSGIALDPEGQILVAWASQTVCQSEIYRVDPDTGDRVMVADEVVIFTNDLAVESDGQILTVGFFGGFCGGPSFLRIYRVDPDSGATALLTHDVSSGLAVVTAAIFGTGFESGDLSRWSGVIQ